MRSLITTIALVIFCLTTICAQSEIRGLSISAPTPSSLEQFMQFTDSILAPAGINTLILRVDYDYQYTSHPELVSTNPLSKADVKRLVGQCRDLGIQIIPQINLLGHQSWHSEANELITQYPEFDETPHIKLPEEYVWPNDDGLYCKSYCPNHPDVHEVVFALVDEIVDVFEASAFHAGLDEVFYIADEKCPRCSGLDPAALFAQEVTTIHNHLSKRGVTLWMWGDRLIDGRETGIGMWEASMNNTHRAIDLIPKDIVICDWHYEKAFPTAAVFAAKGFPVVTCPWRRPQVAMDQVAMINLLKMNSAQKVTERYRGFVHTAWNSSASFINQYYGITPYDPEKADVPGTFRALFGL